MLSAPNLHEEASMSNSDDGRYKATLTVLAGLVLLWGALGVSDIGNQPYSGYNTDGDNNVIQVTTGSPAEAAGLQVGDRIRSVGGVAVEDTRAAFNQPRAEIGEVRTIQVDRDGASMNLDVQYAEQPGDQKVLAYLAILIGLCFLGFGLWAYRGAPGRQTTRLAVLGLLFGLAFLGGPYIASPILRAVVGSVVLFAVLMGFAVLLDHVLNFPKESDGAGVRAIYAPAIVVGIVPIVFTILRPDATSGVNIFFRLLFGLFLLGYFGLALIVIVKTFSKATLPERAAHGLNLMLFGTLVGLGPLLISSLVGLISPQTVLPGQQYLFLTLILIPITFAMAAIKSASGATPATATAAPPPSPESAPHVAPPPPEPPPPSADPSIEE
jgi:hypothetical protein